MTVVVYTIADRAVVREIARRLTVPHLWDGEDRLYCYERDGHLVELAARTLGLDVGSPGLA